MNICDIAFSTEWFLTIPGMLITGGVILLIIALIMLLVSSSKGKKKKANQNSVPVSTGMDMNMAGLDPNMNQMGAVGAVPSMDMGVMPEVPTVSEQMMAPQPTVDPVAPVTPTLEVSNTTPVVEQAMPEIPVMQMPEANAVSSVESVPTLGVETPIANPFQANSIPPVNAPMMENVPFVEQSQVAPIPPVMDAPTVDSIPSVVDVPTIEPVASVTPVVEVDPIAEVVPTETIPVNPTPLEGNAPIYGDLNGGNAEQGSFVQEEPRPIYGGANPLEATQNLPKVDVHHEPYSGGRTVVSEPTVAQQPVIPTVESVPSVSNVESVPVSEVSIPQMVTPTEVPSVDTTPLNNVGPSVVPPVVEPTIPSVQPAVTVPNYNAATPTGAVTDVEQL